MSMVSDGFTVVVMTLCLCFVKGGGGAGGSGGESNTVDVSIPKDVSIVVVCCYWH